MQATEEENKMVTFNTAELRTTKHMRLIRAKDTEGTVRFYNATGCNQAETVTLLRAALSGAETKDEITNERHKELCNKWWTEAEEDPEIEFKS